jgi:hypothetical protein
MHVTARRAPHSCLLPCRVPRRPQAPRRDGHASALERRGRPGALGPWGRSHREAFTAGHSLCWILLGGGQVRPVGALTPGRLNRRSSARAAGRGRGLRGMLVAQASSCVCTGSLLVLLRPIRLCNRPLLAGRPQPLPRCPPGSPAARPACRDGGLLRPQPSAHQARSAHVVRKAGVARRAARVWLAARAGS